MKLLLWIVVAILVVAAVAAGAALLYGRERLWEDIAGPADQGAVDFSHLIRRHSGNDALACSPGLCDGRAATALPAFGEAPAALLTRLDRAVIGGDVARVDDGTDPAYRRYVARTPLLRFPDTIDARAVPLGDGAGLMLYSRSLLGRGDLGTNARRLADWAARLSR